MITDPMKVFVFGGGWDVNVKLSSLSSVHACAWLDGLLNDRDRVRRLGVEVLSMDVARMDGMDIPGNKKGRRWAREHDCGGVGMGEDGLL